MQLLFFFSLKGKLEHSLTAFVATNVIQVTPTHVELCQPDKYSFLNLFGENNNNT